jgi:uroporphyrinogen III methyltransferase/synthase
VTQQNLHEKSGIVSLIGAGPGDPGLITVRGRALLAEADVVVYDALANPRLLDHCRADAERVYVGKRAGCHAMPQDAINVLLIDRGRAGKRVARLKGGDPFVFGRGGEECQALAAAGVPFEVVPGVTAAVAVAAYAGIPVTHRDFNASVTLLSGHDKDDNACNSSIDWSAVAKLPCLVFYMGVRSLDAICRKLIDHGMSPATPAATIANGTTPQQQTIIGTIADLAASVAGANLPTPALTIIGEIVRLRATLNWFESRPLFGQTVVVTRARAQSSELAATLERLGAMVLEAPTILFRDPTSWGNADTALSRLWTRSRATTVGESSTRLRDRTCVVFTSANGVTATHRRMQQLGFDVRLFGATDIAVIGERTGAACRATLGIAPDHQVTPMRAPAEELVRALLAANRVAGNTFVLFRGNLAEPALAERLRQHGAAEVVEAVVYETAAPATLPTDVTDALLARRVDWVTFTSGSTVRNLAALLGSDFHPHLATTKTASIGPITSAAMRASGIVPTVEANQPGIPGLVAAILAATA